MSCGGYTNVSDIFASALWSMDAMINMAAVGIERWNFHGGPNGPYSAIAYNDPKNPAADVVTVRPMFYGLWAFSAATGHGSVLYETKVTSSNGFIKGYAVKDATGTWRVILIHKDPTTSGGSDSASVTIVPPVSLKGAATVVRLSPGPRGIYANDADPITFGGQTFLGTPNGLPSGTPSSESVTPNGDGAYVLTLPLASAAIVTLPAA